MPLISDLLLPVARAGAAALVGLAIDAGTEWKKTGQVRIFVDHWLSEM